MTLIVHGVPVISPSEKDVLSGKATKMKKSMSAVM